MKTDQRIVRAMAELLRVRGYTATGLQQLARAAQAPIGSIYHHFRGGKREVAAAALRQAGAAYIQLLPMLLDQHPDLATAVEAAFAAAAEDSATTGWANMCPVVTVAGEIADTEPELRQVAADVIASWVDAGTQYLASRGLSDTDARAAMYALLTALEGGFLLARAQHAAEPLLAAGRAVSAYIAAMPATARAERLRTGHPHDPDLLRACLPLLTWQRPDRLLARPSGHCGNEFAARHLLVAVRLRRALRRNRCQQQQSWRPERGGLPGA